MTSPETPLEKTCTGPGRPPKKLCGLPAVAGNLCGSHRRQEKDGKTLTPLQRQAERPRAGILKYGLRWSTKANIEAIEKLAKAANQSVSDYVIKRIEAEWLGYTRKEVDQ